jgi:NitT/TauT family transport system substrate-binding protein
VRIRLILNSGFAGPHACFFIARERGYFRAAGLEVELVPGNGAAAIVPLVGRDGIDAGYGDINALAERVARESQAAPIAVFAMFNAAPFTIAVRADGPVHRAADLAGGTLAGHAQDAALKLFPALAEADGIAPGSVTLKAESAGLGEQVRDLLLAGRVAGVFGYVNTIIAALAPLGIDPARLRFINFSDLLPDLYSHVLMVPRELLERSPRQVHALVHGVNRGLVDTLNDIDAGIEAVARVAPPGFDRAVQHRRLTATLTAEMAHPEGARLGIGDVDDARLNRSLATLARCGRWPRLPVADEIFTRSHLPPLDERVRSLAK